MTTKAIGDAAETLACNYLLGQNLTLLDRNYRCKRGEIDLIMRDHQNSLIFIEVRYRRNTSYGSALETINRKKQDRIIYCALCYLKRHRAMNLCSRFDVIAIEGTLQQENITWLKNAFEVAT